MKLFTRRERTAILILCIAALIGTGIRLYLNKYHSEEEIRIIKGAVEVPEGVKAGSTTSEELSLTIDINSTTAEELETLPGIGPVKAKAIIDYRKEHGVFKIPADIQKVPGIGEKTFLRIKPYITAGVDSTNY